MRVRSTRGETHRAADSAAHLTADVPASLVAAAGERDDCGEGLFEVAHRAAIAQPGAGVLVAPGRFPSPDPLYPGCPGLFLQTGCSQQELQAASSLVTQERMGILLTMNSRSRDYSSSLLAVVGGYEKSIGPPNHLLADANRYSGKNRNIATSTGTNLDPNWVHTQRDLGLSVALTDSPYLPAGDQAALAAVLSEAHSFGQDVVAVLAIHLDWLKKDVAVLIDAVNNAGVPVALVLEHAGDPLGVKSALAGLVRLLGQAKVKVALLRSDLSVIGAVAFGATFGAVGTTTGMRHLYPKKDDNDSGFNPSAGIGAFVPRSMAYRRLDKINTAIALDPDNQDRWTCQCRFCNGRTLDYIVDETQAYQHSLAAIAQLGETVLSGGTELIRRHAWVRGCQHAQTVNLEIGADTGLKWDPPDFLGAWHKLIATLPPLTQDPV